MTKVLCAGIAVLDFIFELDTFPDAAEKYVARDTAIVGGGCAANAAVAVTRLGGRAVLAAELGDDPVGRLILEDLAAEGVDVSAITPVPGARSSYSSVYVDRAGERQIVNFRGTPMAPDIAAIEAHDDLAAVLVDTRRPDLARAALDRAQALGIPGIVDGEAPVPPDLPARATHVAFSRRGLAALHPDLSPERALARVADETGAWVCVTDGANGVWHTNTGTIAHLAAFVVEVRDTLGAGDIWHCAFALALAEGLREPDAVRMASAAAAMKCAVPGGRAGTPTRTELESFLKART